MNQELLDKARAGIDAWQRGDLSALKGLLDPNVDLLWWKPGGWDCHSRTEVLRLLRERHEQGVAGGRHELIDAGDDLLIAVYDRAKSALPAGPERPRL